MRAIIGLAVCLCIASCSEKQVKAPDMSKAEKMGVTLESFDGAAPVLLAMSAHHDSLFAALSLRSDHPKAVKRHLRAEITHVALDCVEAFGAEERRFSTGFDRYNERLMRRAGSSETEAQWLAFEPAFKARLRDKLNGMVDFSSVIPPELVHKTGEARSEAGASMSECEALFDAIETHKPDFR
jgi:hypothetical protein